MLCKEGNEVVVSNFRKIGNAWKQMSFNVTRARIVNCVLNVQFDSDKDYEFYIEHNIMKSLYINYLESDIKGKADIAKMVTKRKAKLVKNLNYRGLKTHSCKISTI